MATFDELTPNAIYGIGPGRYVVLRLPEREEAE